MHLWKSSTLLSVSKPPECYYREDGAEEQVQNSLWRTLFDVPPLIRGIEREAVVEPLAVQPKSHRCKNHYALFRWRLEDSGIECKGVSSPFAGVGTNSTYCGLTPFPRRSREITGTMDCLHEATIVHAIVTHRHPTSP